MEFPVLSGCSAIVFDYTIKKIHSAMIANMNCEAIYGSIQNAITWLIYMKIEKGEDTTGLINEFNKCLHSIKVNDRQRVHNIVRDMHYKCMLMEANSDDEEDYWVHVQQKTDVDVDVDEEEWVHVEQPARSFEYFM
jgi:hypothetical protein